jgi:hypothetical protein
MNRLFVYALILNVMLLGVFVVLDMITWDNVGLGLDSQIYAIQVKGALAWSWADYTGFQVGISMGYFPNGPSFAYAVGTVSTVNLPLIWFIVAIAVNLSLIGYTGKKRMNEPTEDLKIETISARQQNDKLVVQK